MRNVKDYTVFKTIKGNERRIDNNWFHLESIGGLGGDYLGGLSMPIQYKQLILNIAEDYPYKLFINGNEI